MGQGASIGGVEIEKPEGASIEQVTNANVALVFVKPHAANEKVIEFVKAELEKKLTVLGTCSLGAAAIEAGGLVDKHYAGICKNALETEPFELAVSDEAKAAFQAKFEKSYDEMISSGAILNSKQFMESEGGGTPDAPMAPKDLFATWNLAEAKGAKLAPGCYVRQVVGVGPGEEEEEDSPPSKWVINGFYPLMRSKYLEEEAAIQLFVVAFDPDKLSWAQFRGDLIGATNPASAAEGSLRALCKAKFAELGLKEEPNNTDNCVHASAGPLEGIKERSIWLDWTLETDPTGSKMLDICLDEKSGIEQLLQDPPIDLYGLPPGTTAFDLTEDKNTKEAFVLANNWTFREVLAEYITPAK